MLNPNLARSNKVASAAMSCNFDRWPYVDETAGLLPCNFPVSLCVDKNGVGNEISMNNLGVVVTKLKAFAKLK